MPAVPGPSYQNHADTEIVIPSRWSYHRCWVCAGVWRLTTSWRIQRRNEATGNCRPLIFPYSDANCIHRLNTAPGHLVSCGHSTPRVGNPHLVHLCNNRALPPISSSLLHSKRVHLGECHIANLRKVFCQVAEYFRRHQHLRIGTFFIEETDMCL